MMPRYEMAEIEAIQTEMLKKMLDKDRENLAKSNLDNWQLRYDELSKYCVNLREVMLNKDIGWERLGDMVGYPELVIDTAIEYFKSLPDPIVELESD
jgi:hypothetical protein